MWSKSLSNRNTTLEWYGRSQWKYFHGHRHPMHTKQVNKLSMDAELYAEPNQTDFNTLCFTKLLYPAHTVPHHKCIIINWMYVRSTDRKAKKKEKALIFCQWKRLGHKYALVHFELEFPTNKRRPDWFLSQKCSKIKWNWNHKLTVYFNLTTWNIWKLCGKMEWNGKQTREKKKEQEKVDQFKSFFMRRRHQQQQHPPHHTTNSKSSKICTRMLNGSEWVFEWNLRNTVAFR